MRPRFLLDVVDDELYEYSARMQIEPLQLQLDTKRAEFERTAPEEKQRIYAEGIAAVEASGVVLHARNVGDQAPDFELTNAIGESVRLSDQLAEGPVVLTWYRGGWCPYCNMTLRALQGALAAIRGAGARLIALTPELPDRSLSTAEKHALSFHVLSDLGNHVAREYGIVFALTAEVAAIYQASFGLHEFNGDQSNELPLAATYVIDSSGVIRWAFLDAEYRNRAEPAKIVEVLKTLG